MPSENPEKLFNEDGSVWDGQSQAYRPSGVRASSNVLLEAQIEEKKKVWPTPQARDWKGPSGRSIKNKETDLPNEVKNWETPRAMMSAEGEMSMYTKEGNYKKDFKHRLENQVRIWGTPTSSQLEQNESLDSYLRRSKKRIDNGKTVFPTQLTFEVESEERGIDIKHELDNYKGKVNEKKRTND